MSAADPMRDYVVLDVFTDVPLEGNALGVFTDATGLDGALMQRAARELNLSETVFVLPGDADCDARIRIFTPGAELPFAGHPVLGTAYVLAERRGLERVRLGTGSGVIEVALRRTGDGTIEFGEMEQPIPSITPFRRGDDLLRALGVAHAVLPLEQYVNGPAFVMVALAGADEVRALRPDLRALGGFGDLGVSCFAGAGARFTTRMFAPALGVAEDPATGSAAGPLALHLARHGRVEFGRWIEIRQGAEILRPSLIHARVDGSAGAVRRIAVGGSAVFVAEGRYRLGPGG
jgi:trans-2,3-dihydro-3-hydroxyanthranilate isomerase